MTPREVQYQHRLIIENRTITVLAYNLETILAEKLETIVVRSVDNTRPKDFYDVYALDHLERQNIDFGLLKVALLKTSQKRGSLLALQNYHVTLERVSESAKLQKQWEKYQVLFSYAKGIDFAQTCQAADDLLDGADISH